MAGVSFRSTGPQSLENTAVQHYVFRVMNPCNRVCQQILAYFRRIPTRVRTVASLPMPICFLQFIKALHAETWPTHQTVMHLSLPDKGGQKCIHRSQYLHQFMAITDTRHHTIFAPACNFRL
jgi:hypothetical protein